MPTTSAGLLLYRRCDNGWEVLLVHPGGPFWTTKNREAWSIPKGVVNENENLLQAARREFEEETGFSAGGQATALGSIRQRGGKRVYAWAVRGDVDPDRLTSNRFEIEWPPHSGRIGTFPEIDKAAWFRISEARQYILPAQAFFLDELCARLDAAARD